MLMKPWMIETCIAAAACALVSPVMGQTCVVRAQERLYAPIPTWNQEFGGQIACHGDVLAVSAHSNHGSAPDNGLVFVYRKQGNQWILEQTLNPEPQAGGGFGNALSIGDNLIAVNGTNHVYVFRFDGIQWGIEAILQPANALPNDAFGISVAIDGDTLVAGTQPHLSYGRAYIFKHDRAGWHEQQQLTTPPPLQTYDGFGLSVAVSGAIVVVGAPYHDGAVGENSGGAYVFRFDGATWNFEKRLRASDAAAGQVFGFPVLIDNGRVYCGASHQDSVYVYEHDGAAWIEDQHLTGSNPEYGHNLFGSSIAVRDNVLAVGAFNDHSPTYPQNCGAVYLFDLVGNQWVQSTRVISNLIENQQFGRAIALSADSLLVGDASESMPDANYAGAVVSSPLQHPDCNSNGLFDECEAFSGGASDANGNKIPDDCDIASGHSLDCDVDGIPDESQPPSIYTLDNGNVSGYWGQYGGNELLWLNQYVVAPGAQVINAIELPWTGITISGQSAKVLVYADPNNDGDPNDARLLRIVNSITQTAWDNPNVPDILWSRVAMPPTYVGFPGEKFFIACLVSITSVDTNTFVLSDGAASLGRSWSKVGPVSSIDIINPGSGSNPIHNFPRNWMLRAIAGDCDGDGISNQCEIANGAADFNSNGIPDACENPCPPDIAPSGGGNSSVDIDDLVALITSWGTSEGGHDPADLNFDGAVNIDDLVLLITHWGPCA